MRINLIKLTENFSLHEFECRCCHTVRLKPRLLKHLQFLRDGWGQPIVVTSGYRCAAHNAAVGGAVRSRHLLGGAVDVKIPANLQDIFCGLAVRCGFAKALSYGERNFVHLEV